MTLVFAHAVCTLPTVFIGRKGQFCICDGRCIHPHVIFCIKNPFPFVEFFVADILFVTIRRTSDGIVYHRLVVGEGDVSVYPCTVIVPHAVNQTELATRLQGILARGGSSRSQLQLTDV